MSGIFITPIWVVQRVVIRQLFWLFSSKPITANVLHYNTAEVAMMLTSKNFYAKTTLTQKLILALPWLILLLGLILTVSVWNEQHKLVAANALTRYERKLEQVEAIFVAKLTANNDPLNGARALFSASDNVERRDWHNFTAGLNLAERNPALSGLGFIQYLTLDTIPAFLQQVRQDIPDFPLKSRNGHLDYFVVKYIEPASASANALGFDAGSEDVRREALEKSRDTGDFVLTGKITDVDASNPIEGLVVYMPVYSGGATPATIQERRDKIQGWVYAPVQLSVLLKDLLGKDADAFALRVIADNSAVPVYDSLRDTGQASPKLAPLYSRKVSVFAANRNWQLEFFTLPAFNVASNLSQPDIFLFLGLPSSILAFILSLWISVLQVSHSQQTEERNRQLNAALFELENRQYTSQEVSKRVFSLASELSTTATQQASGSRDQVLLVEEVTESVNQLSATAVNIDDLTQKVTEIARQVSQDSLQIEETTRRSVGQGAQGLAAVERTQLVGEEVGTVYQQLLAMFEELSTRHANMRLILRLLSSIAGETHLLALNAAIEAAGAGTQGQRFRIVAQEIRNLALRSSTASNEVVEIINSIEEATEAAQEIIKSGYEKAGRMVFSIEETGQLIRALQEVVQESQLQAGCINIEVQEIKNLSEIIRGATGQQRSASGQVLGALNGLSTVALQNNEGSAQISNAAVDLESLSHNLNLRLAA